MLPAPVARGSRCSGIGGSGLGLPVRPTATGKENMRQPSLSSSAAVDSSPPKPQRPRSGAHPLLADVDFVAPISPARRAVLSSAPSPPRPPLSPARRGPLAAAIVSPAASPAPATSAAGIALRRIELRRLAMHGPAPPVPRPAAAAIPALAAVASSTPAAASAATATSATPSAASSSSAASATAHLVAPSAASSVVDRVVRHWRTYKRDRVDTDDFSLDHRVDRFLVAGYLRRWHARAVATKQQWKARIHARTIARFHFLRSSFDRWRVRVCGPDRPSVQRQAAQLLKAKALEFLALQRRSRAILQWKQRYVASVVRGDQLERASETRAGHLLRDAWSGWKHRLQHLRLVRQRGVVLTSHHLGGLVTRTFAAWRASQESSALSRLQAGVARRFAYRSTLRRMVAEWRKVVGRALAAEPRGSLLEIARDRLHKHRVWLQWTAMYRRQALLARVMQRCHLARVLDAKHVVMQRWHGYLLRERHAARLMAIATRQVLQQRQRRALHAWRQRIRLWRVQRLMGAASFACMRRGWSVWRRALATLRSYRRSNLHAVHHATWHGLDRAVSRWRKSTVELKARRLLLEQAQQVWQQHATSLVVQRWHAIAARSHQRSVHLASAVHFCDQRAKSSVVAHLRSLVSHVADHANHHRMILQHQRHRGFALWRQFTAERLDNYNAARKAKRFKYMRTLATPFRAWRSMRVKERALEARLSLRGQPIVQRLKQQLLAHWLHLTRASRGQRFQNGVADAAYSSRLVADCFRVWFAQFAVIYRDRVNTDRSTRHRRLGLLTRLFRAWDAHSYAQRHARRRMQEGVQWIRQRLDGMQRRRLFTLWKERLARLNHMRALWEQAELHHARVTLCRSYRTLQHVYALRLAQAQRVAKFTSTVQLGHCRTYLDLWHRALAARRQSLHKNVLALRFWARRVVLLGWRGWLKYHCMKQWKAHLLRTALEQRRDKLRRVGLISWLRAGLDLHESALLIAQRSDPTAFSSLRHRRLALRCARLWREHVRRRRQQDQRVDGFNRRIMHLLPFSATSFHNPRPMPLPLPVEAPPRARFEEHKEHSPSAPSSEISPLDSAPSTSSLFPSLAKNRPPPRRPVDLMMDFPITLPLQAITAHARMPQMVAPEPSIAPAEFEYSPASPAPIDGSYTVASTSFVSSDPSVAASFDGDRVIALEDQLHRLLEWKRASQQRRALLQQLSQQAPGDVSAQVTFASLQREVAEDQEHRPYFQERVQQVQLQIRAMMDESTEATEHAGSGAPALFAS